MLGGCSWRRVNGVCDFPDAHACVVVQKDGDALCLRQGRDSGKNGAVALREFLLGMCYGCAEIGERIEVDNRVIRVRTADIATCVQCDSDHPSTFVFERVERLSALENLDQRVLADVLSVVSGSKGRLAQSKDEVGIRVDQALCFPLDLIGIASERAIAVTACRHSVTSNWSWWI